MNDTNRSEDWRVLCELASKEKDPEKLIDLISKINQALEEAHNKSRSPFNANAYFYRIAPVLPAAGSVRLLVTQSASALGFFGFLPKPLCHPPHPNSVTR